jgi:hypothetical protein
MLILSIAHIGQVDMYVPAHTMMQWSTNLQSFLEPLGRLLPWLSLFCWQGDTNETLHLQQCDGRTVTGQEM